MVYISFESSTFDETANWDLHFLYIVQYIHFTEDTPWSANFSWYGVWSRPVFLCIDILLFNYFSTKQCFFHQIISY